MTHNIGNFNEKNKKEMRTFITVTMGVSCVSWFHFFYNSFQLSTHKNTKNTPIKKKATDFQMFIYILEVSFFRFPRKKPPPPGRGRTTLFVVPKKAEVWDASKLKYEVIDTKLTGAPLQVVKTDGGCRSFLGALNRDISGEIYKGNKLR